MPSDVHGNVANDGDAGEMPTMIGNCHGNGLSDEASGGNAAEDVPLQDGTLSDTGERKKSSATTKKGRRRLMRRVTSSMMEAIEVGQKVFSYFMRVVGAIFVCVAVCLISFVTYTYFTAVLPVLEMNDFNKALMTFVGVFLVINAVYNYFKAMLMDPGTPPDFDEVELLVKAQAEENGAPAPRQCKKCSAYKAERSHHCRICGRCVLKMDHHCPWINNCVGFRNYRNFCLFLLFLTASCVYCLVVFYPLFEEIMTLPSRLRRGTRDGRHNVMTSFTIAGSVLVALGLLGGMHVYLVLSNQTTIEFQLNFFTRGDALKHGVLSRNQYNVGRRRNFQQVFGPSAFCHFTWLLSWLAPPPAGDGLEFPSNAAHRR